MEFRGHNIRLDDGTYTMGQLRPLLSDSAFMRAIKRALIAVFGTDHDTYTRLKAVDLACMEGGFSIELARMGISTLGIDARKVNLLKANYAKFRTNATDVNFELDDVRHLARYGPFDITLCLGILYHLPDPAHFLRMVYEQTGRVLIVHSFYAPGSDILYDMKRVSYTAMNRIPPVFGLRKFPRYPKSLREEAIAQATTFAQHIKSYRLGPLVKHEGYHGRWYKEWSSGSKGGMEAKIQASYGNQYSFWMCKDDLIRALYAAGFSTVFEQMDDIGDMATKYPAIFYGRTMLVALK